MDVYCWCIMPSHVHLIYKAKENNPEIVLGRFKEYTSKQLVKLIEANLQESRKEWMLWIACSDLIRNLKEPVAKAATLKQTNFGSIIPSPLRTVETVADIGRSKP